MTGHSTTKFNRSGTAKKVDSGSGTGSVILLIDLDSQTEKIMDLGGSGSETLFRPWGYRVQNIVGILNKNYLMDSEVLINVWRAIMI